MQLKIHQPQLNEDIFSYLERNYGAFDLTLYRQIVGAANEFKEGDETLGIAAADDLSRENARILLSNTKIKDLENNPLYVDEIFELITKTTHQQSEIKLWLLADLKAFLLKSSELEIKKIMPALSSDVIACVVKLMSNEEIILVSQKVFNPLPNSNIGSKGYLSARVQPNSPTDHPDDIIWQVFNAWSFAVGDLVLGCNPVSSEPASVAQIENALFDIITTFGLEDTIPNCVLSHIDVQAEVENIQPGTTGVWFQSIASTVNANKTFDVSVQKMFDHLSRRKGKYGFYGETGQGADFTNGHGEGFDMLVHEARKYGFLRALKLKMNNNKKPDEQPWFFVNDVAGFIGPEVFKTKEQLVRCCLEDTLMGKLHGLCIGLDICSTLHMDVTLQDLDWCIEQVMPANPAYLMALPTKSDPMLSYLTTSFANNLKIRNQFGYRVNDTMWDFFKKIAIIDENNQPTKHFGDPIWVYYQYCIAKNDKRSKEVIYAEGREKIKEITARGVAIAEGYGENIWDLNPDLERQVQTLYEDAKRSLWTEFNPSFVQAIPNAVTIETQSKNRKDYVYHPESGEKLAESSIKKLKEIRENWSNQIPDIQIIISDGLNAKSLMDEGHLIPFLSDLRKALGLEGYSLGRENLVIINGRVRSAYQCGEVLFGEETSTQLKGIVHIIGERPGTEHHNFSAYITFATAKQWNKTGCVDHDITKVISGISDTALVPKLAAKEAVMMIDQLFGKPN